MTTSFKHLRNCDKRTLKIVNGYVHQIQKLFPWQENSYFIIPELINHICLSFYWITFAFNTKYIGENIKIINDTTAQKIKSSNSRMCAIGESISADLCDIFQIEYLLKDHEREFCPFIGFFTLKRIDDKCGVDFNSALGCNDKYVIGISIDSEDAKEVSVYGDGHFWKHLDLNHEAKKGDRFMLEFHFDKSEFYLYHNDRKVEGITIKVKSSHIIPLLALYEIGEVVEITKYKFIHKF